MTGRRAPRTRAISRDTVTWVVGLGLMIYQGTLPVAEFNLAVFLGGMVISGIPMGANAFALITGRTGGLGLPSPVEQLPPEPSTPSSEA